MGEKADPRPHFGWPATSGSNRSCDADLLVLIVINGRLLRAAGDSPGTQQAHIHGWRVHLNVSDSRSQAASRGDRANAAPDFHGLMRARGD